VINLGEEPQRSLWQGEWRLLGDELSGARGQDDRPEWIGSAGLP
jgi:hypothetical protein